MRHKSKIFRERTELKFGTRCRHITDFYLKKVEKSDPENWPKILFFWDGYWTELKVNADKVRHAEWDRDFKSKKNRDSTHLLTIWPIFAPKKSLFPGGRRKMLGISYWFAIHKQIFGGKNQNAVHFAWDITDFYSKKLKNRPENWQKYPFLVLEDVWDRFESKFRLRNTLKISNHQQNRNLTHYAQDKTVFFPPKKCNKWPKSLFWGSSWSKD